MSDDEWVARVRARYNEGGMDRLDTDPVFDDIPGDAERPVPSAAAVPRCPSCEHQPGLTELVGRVASDGLRSCPVCLGVWALDAAVSRGIAPAGPGESPLLAAEAPRRCRRCAGYLKPGGACAKCGWARPLLTCAACSAPMARYEQQGVQLDRCDPCRATWFDAGEVARVFGIERPRTIADRAATSDSTGEGFTPTVFGVLGQLLAAFFR